MCNKRSESKLKDPQEHMDDLIMDPGSARSSNEDKDKSRVKFLCSFSGSILPRPHDGKLRYVGGETRILSLPCDIKYNELMDKMREIYDCAVILKYQQPDEDLDALVSVVNDDDVINMMEEYDKVGAGDGFTKLRVFLFSVDDLDGSIHFIVDGDERESERRYMEALNSLNESLNYTRNHSNEDNHIGGVEQLFNQMNLENGGLHNPRNNDLHMPPIHLRQLNIPPPLMSAQSISQMESPRSATAPYNNSPRQQPSVLEPRQVAEYPTSPSSSRYRAQYAELSDNFDRLYEEYNRNQTNQSLYEHQQYNNNNTGLIFPTAVPNEKPGFSVNVMGSGTNVFDGNNICNNCRITFPRNQLYPEPTFYQTHTEQQSMGNNGFHHVVTPCAECPPNNIYYNPADQNDHRRVSNDNQNRGRGWTLQHHQVTPRAEELRPHNNGDNHNNVPLHHLVHFDDPRYIRFGPEVSNQVFQEGPFAAGSNVHIQPMDERGIPYANPNRNPSYAVRTDGVFQVGHGPNVSSPSLWRNVQSPMHGGASYDPSGLINPGYIRMEGSPKLQTGFENQNPWIEASPKNLGLDSEAHRLSNAYNPENGLFHKVDPVHSPSLGFAHPPPLDPSLGFAPPPPPLDPSLGFAPPPPPLDLSLGFAPPPPPLDPSLGFAPPPPPLDPSLGFTPPPPLDPSLGFAPPPPLDPSLGFTPSPLDPSLGFTPSPLDPSLGFAVSLDPSLGFVRPSLEERKGSVREEMVEPSGLIGFVSTSQNIGSDGLDIPVAINATIFPVPNKSDEIKSEADINGGIEASDTDVKEEQQNVLDVSDVHEDLDLDSEIEKSRKSKIELTKAEEEALSRGLQTVRNEDLEEIRELGTGTYGAVFHGKWKGSDVAIKRIKASCFAGRPSERERLISDFWKEALILSSLHHPNVVSFYGVVRDGPDGSLATVTEFMVNGSLKQFLQKKDRTIDRRKRLLIGMDTAFGMEYLHGKSIVHFDLKCENLLVNMRDPHRPVCKIGDLGLSKVKQHTLVSGGVRGTLPWMAPELLSGKSNMVTEKIDVYSFGVVMWELLTGDEPYKDTHCASIIGGIVNNTLRPTIPTWCDPEWKSLMESCWCSDPSLRPSFAEISHKLRSMAAAMNLK